MTARARRPLQKRNQWQLPRANGLERSTIAMFYGKDGRRAFIRWVNNQLTTLPWVNAAGNILPWS